jgi:hypothetical protein
VLNAGFRSSVNSSSGTLVVGVAEASERNASADPKKHGEHDHGHAKATPKLNCRIPARCIFFLNSHL